MKIIKKAIWLSLFILVMVNLVFFLKRGSLSRAIKLYEKKIVVLENENDQLSQKVLLYGSLNYASSMAPKLGFVKKAEPVVLDKLFYARR